MKQICAVLLMLAAHVMSAQERQVKVIQLQHADPDQMAKLLTLYKHPVQTSREFHAIRRARLRAQAVAVRVPV